MAAEEEREEGEGEEQRAERGVRLGGILRIGILVLVVLILAAGGAFFVITRFLSGGPSRVAGEVVSEPPSVFSLARFETNLADKDENHVISVKMSLAYPKINGKENERLTRELEERVPQIRDIIILHLGTKYARELGDERGKEKLKMELISKINGKVRRESGRISDIFFEELVIQ
ncbi:MAG: flagellar basal body-associated FliL family protein [bacterium]